MGSTIFSNNEFQICQNNLSKIFQFFLMHRLHHKLKSLIFCAVLLKKFIKCSKFFQIHLNNDAHACQQLDPSWHHIQDSFFQMVFNETLEELPTQPSDALNHVLLISKTRKTVRDVIVCFLKEVVNDHLRIELLEKIVSHFENCSIAFNVSRSGLTGLLLLVSE